MDTTARKQKADDASPDLHRQIRESAIRWESVLAAYIYHTGFANGMVMESAEWKKKVLGSLGGFSWIRKVQWLWLDWWRGAFQMV
ncbi:hypothetical protein VTL71DRAFT_7601, partial [Oculimacula yallundae]